MPPNSLLPKLLPVTELVALMLLVDIGVIGGVTRGKGPGLALPAATLGTVPIVGVGLIAMVPLGI